MGSPAVMSADTAVTSLCAGHLSGLKLRLVAKKAAWAELRKPVSACKQLIVTAWQLAATVPEPCLGSIHIFNSQASAHTLCTLHVDQGRSVIRGHCNLTLSGG